LADRQEDPAGRGDDAAQNVGVLRDPAISKIKLINRLRQLEDEMTEKDDPINVIKARRIEAERGVEPIASTLWTVIYPLRWLATNLRRALLQAQAARAGVRSGFFRSVVIKAIKFAVDRFPDYIVDRLVVLLPYYAVDSLPDCLIDRLSDYSAVNVQYFQCFRRFPDLKCPETFNEKIAWRKLYQRNPKFRIFSDKVAVKAEVAKLIGEQHIIETLWVGDTPESIPFDELELPYVIKVNHSSRSNIFVRTKQDLNKEEIVQSIRGHLHYDHGHTFREWGYLDIPRRVLVERMIEMPGDDTPEDYQFYVYHGCVHFIDVVVDRFKLHTMSTYDRDWELVPIYSDYPTTARPIARPLHLEQMITIAEKIGGQFDFARVDLYSPPQGILFGEVTFYPGGGLSTYPEEFGRLWRVCPLSSSRGRFLDPTFTLVRTTMQSSKRLIKKLTLRLSRVEALLKKPRALP
jgi:TupA-like ATPgrasp